MKTVVITGANRGLGLALSKSLVKLDYHVIITGRSLAKLENSILDVKNYSFLELDLMNYSSITSFVKNLKGLCSELNLLIHNAAILNDTDRSGEISLITPDIVENTFKTNLFGPIELTRQLLPLLTENSVVLNIGARPALFRHLSQTTRYPMYRLSKLALHGWSTIMSSFFEDLGVTIFNIHPGWIKTDMGGSDAPFETDEVADQIINILQGDTSIYHGKLLVDWKIAEW